MEHPAVIGVYPTRVTAERAADVLRSYGFRDADVSVVVAERPGRAGPPKRGGLPTPSAVLPNPLPTCSSRNDMIGYVGVVKGQRVVARGPMRAALREGMPRKSFVEVLEEVGVAPYEAKRCEGGLGKGGALLAVLVDAPERERQAIAVMDSTGASGVSVAVKPAHRVPECLVST